MLEVMEANNLYDYIDLLKVRTAMFIGDNKISTLYAHLHGYNMACSLKKIEEKLEPEFHLFNDFVADYYLYGESSAGWKNIILAEHFGDEKRALETFFALFNEFRQNVRPTNSKKILYKLLDKITRKQVDLTDFKNGDELDVQNLLMSLPNQLERVDFRFQYDEILNKLDLLADSNILLKKLLEELKTTTI